eukprot:scaffold64985_cov57-Phaeocystis_antarctica.AAC.3
MICKRTALPRGRPIRAAKRAPKRAWYTRGQMHAHRCGPQPWYKPCSPGCPKRAHCPRGLAHGIRDPAAAPQAKSRARLSDGSADDSSPWPRPLLRTPGPLVRLAGRALQPTQPGRAFQRLRRLRRDYGVGGRGLPI